MDISLTWFAKGLIKRRGGQLWVWETPVGQCGLGLIRTASSAPSGIEIEFEAVVIDGLRLWFERDFPIREVTIGWTPETGFDVTWFGTMSPPNGGG